MFGAAEAPWSSEEFLVGEEVSLLARSATEAATLPLPSRGIWAVFDGDTDPNTGMGAYL